ncbi:MAG: phosphoglycerate kinase [Candidatus Woesearchaeota archaeon]
MKYKIIDNLKLKKKRVLLRVDLNTEIINNNPVFSERFKAHLKTIEELLKKQAKVVVLAHQGRKGKKDFISLKKHSKLLKINFINDIYGKKAINAIKKLKFGEALLLENVRFSKEEFNKNYKKNKMLKALAPHFDYFINDAFSVSHRDETSITGFPKVLSSAIGRVMENELKHINKIKLKNTLYILGGIKPEDIKLLLDNHKILSTGIFSLLTLKSKGVKFGAQDKKLSSMPRIKKLKNIKTPIDFAIEVKGKRKEISIKDLPTKYPILDIGPKTIKEYSKIIKNSKSIFFKGAAGVYEKNQFSKGTKELLKSIEESKAFSVIAGGSANNAIKRFKIKRNKINYVSLSGGALIYYIAGKKLPGLEAIK